MLAFLGKQNRQQFGFLPFYNNPHPAMPVFSVAGDGAGQNISKTTGAIMKRKCLLCPEFKPRVCREGSIRKGKSRIAGHISICSFGEHLSASNIGAASYQRITQNMDATWR